MRCCRSEWNPFLVLIFAVISDIVKIYQVQHLILTDRNAEELTFLLHCEHVILNFYISIWYIWCHKAAKDCTDSSETSIIQFGSLYRTALPTCDFVCVCVCGSSSFKFHLSVRHYGKKCSVSQSRRSQIINRSRSVFLILICYKETGVASSGVRASTEEF